MKLTYLALLAALLGAGCKTAGPFLTPAAIQSDTALATSLGVTAYPQYKPAITLARDLICTAAATTNNDPTKIIADLTGAGITNSQTTLIVYAGLILYEQAYSALGSNATKAQPYLQAVCSGLSAGLGNMATARAKKFQRP